MEQKIKFILIGLIGLSLVCGFLFLQAQSSKQQLLKDLEGLKTENVSLSEQSDKLKKNLRSYETKISSLTKEIDTISREKKEFESKYESINKEKEGLTEKIKSLEGRQTVAPQEQVQEQQEPRVTDAYWAGVLKAKTDLELQLGSIRNELKSIQISNEQVQREKGVLELDINNLKNENNNLKRQLEYNKKVMDSISQELVREKNDKMQMENNLKSASSENSLLLRQLKSLTSRKVVLERKLQELQEAKITIERRLNEMETMLTDKVSQMGGLQKQLDVIRGGAALPESAFVDKKDSVELPPIVVRPQESAGSSAEIARQVSGRVLALNRENNFAIIDLDENATANIGKTFQVIREGRSIGEIEVIQLGKTNKNIAACDIKKESVPFKIGDLVQ